MMAAIRSLDAQRKNHYNGLEMRCAEGVHEYVATVLADHLAEGSRLVELGAGTGALSSRLSDHGHVVFPFDLDPAAWGNPNIELRAIDCNDSNWPARIVSVVDGIGAVVAVELIEHLDAPRQFILNLARTLPLGGYCLVSTPNLLSAPSLVLAIFRGQFFAFSRAARHATGHISPVPGFLLEEFLAEAGFEVVSRQRVGKAQVAWWLDRLIRAANRVLALMRNEPVGLDHELVTVMVARRTR